MIRTRAVGLALVVLAGVQVSPADAVKLDASQAAMAALVRSRFPTAEASFAVQVAYCESTLRPRAVSPRNRDGTRDHGLFQLNDGGTMQGLGLTRAEALDPAANVDGAVRLWRRRGWQPWTCARKVRRRGGARIVIPDTDPDAQEAPVVEGAPRARWVYRRR